MKSGKNNNNPTPPEWQKNGLDPGSHLLCHCCSEKDQQLSTEALATADGSSVSTIHAVLHQDSGLEQKFARWAPKLL